MLAKRIVACLDVADGRVVKGVRFEGLRDVGDPAELAARYEHEGADEIVFLDIHASHHGRATMWEAVRTTARALSIPLTVGGGIRSPDDMQAALRAGADKVAVNTMAVERPALVTECARRFGAQAVVVAVDAQRHGPSWSVRTHGGRTGTGLDAVEWSCRAAQLGAGEILLTSIDRDGTGEGYDLELVRAVASRLDVPLVASGGCGTVEHIRDALAAGADAALVASLFHDRRATVKESKDVAALAGLPVRR